MRRTYAYNSIIFGVLLGALVWVSTESVVLGVIAGLAVSVVGFVIIRLIENAIDKGVDKAADSITHAYHSHKAKKAASSGVQSSTCRTTQFPVSERRRPSQASANASYAARHSDYLPAHYPSREQARRVMADIRSQEPYASRRCPCCGAFTDDDARFCTACGSVMQYE